MTVQDLNSMFYHVSIGFLFYEVRNYIMKGQVMVRVCSKKHVGDLESW